MDGFNVKPNCRATAGGKDAAAGVPLGLTDEIIGGIARSLAHKTFFIKEHFDECTTATI
jgi:hypothetical protein